MVCDLVFSLAITPAGTLCQPLIESITVSTFSTHSSILIENIFQKLFIFIQHDAITSRPSERSSPSSSARASSFPGDCQAWPGAVGSGYWPQPPFLSLVSILTIIPPLMDSYLLGNLKTFQEEIQKKSAWSRYWPQPTIPFLGYHLYQWSNYSKDSVLKFYHQWTFVLIYIPKMPVKQCK